MCPSHVSFDVRSLLSSPACLCACACTCGLFPCRHTSIRLMRLTCLPSMLRMSPREDAGEVLPIHFKREADVSGPADLCGKMNRYMRLKLSMHLSARWTIKLASVTQTHREDAEEISCSHPAPDIYASAPAEEEDDIPDIDDLELEDHEIDEVRRFFCILHCRASLHS